MLHAIFCELNWALVFDRSPCGKDVFRPRVNDLRAEASTYINRKHLNLLVRNLKNICYGKADTRGRLGGILNSQFSTVSVPCRMAGSAL